MKLHADHRTVFETQHGVLYRQVAYFERAEDAAGYARMVNEASEERAAGARRSTPTRQSRGRPSHRGRLGHSRWLRAD